MIQMKQLREVSKTEKILFPIIVTIFVSLMLPSAASLVGALMLGNLMRESGVVERLNKTAQNELMNTVTIFLGISVGATATAGVPQSPDALHPCARYRRVRLRHGGRRSACKADERVPQG